MSVVVKGMKMPENCWECTGARLNVGVSVFGGICPYCEKIVKDHNMQTGRHPECPLGALPDKHGRLVDADAMCNDLVTVDIQYQQMIEWCISVTEAQPTIVEAEDSE